MHTLKIVFHIHKLCAQPNSIYISVLISLLCPLNGLHVVYMYAHGMVQGVYVNRGYVHRGFYMGGHFR